MSDYDAFHERGRSLEEDYFRKKNRELIDKMTRDTRDEELRREMAAQVGVHDPEMLRELQKLGFTPETVSLLPLVPVVQVAWADGEVADAERSAIFKLAGARGIAEGSAAYHQLSAWLEDRPAAEVFASATRLIGAILDSPDGDHAGLSAEQLVAHCESIAAAAGGLFGLHKISSEERALLRSLAASLKARTS